MSKVDVVNSIKYFGSLYQTNIPETFVNNSQDQITRNAKNTSFF